MYHTYTICLSELCRRCCVCRDRCMPSGTWHTPPSIPFLAVTYKQAVTAVALNAAGELPSTNQSNDQPINQSADRSTIYTKIGSIDRIDQSGNRSTSKKSSFWQFWQFCFRSRSNRRFWIAIFPDLPEIEIALYMYEYCCCWFSITAVADSRLLLLLILDSESRSRLCTTGTLHCCRQTVVQEERFPQMNYPRPPPWHVVPCTVP